MVRARLEAALLTRPPQLLHQLFGGCQWAGPTHSPSGAPQLYLTFDDGPIPEETPWVLEQLARFQARAVFFCVGENLERHPDIARATLAAGHQLGNHTHLHRSAWASPRADYLAGVARCQQVLVELERQVFALNNQQPNTNNLVPTTKHQQPLFRPPYGRLTWPLLRELRARYQVVMWSMLTRDYNPALSPENCLRLALAAVQPGDVVVFHDSRKASARLRYVLPRLLEHFGALGYEFGLL